MSLHDIEDLRPKVVVSFSGGKDSTWMLLEMIRRGEHIDSVAFFDTGWEFPQMYEHVEKIKTIVEGKGIEFVTIRPEHSFDYYMFDKPIKNGHHYGYSWCGYKGCRWGTTYKTQSIDNYYKQLPNHIKCIGIAADEPQRVGKNGAENKRYPLVEWGITERECLQGCYAQGFDWGGLYEQLDRVSCKFCGLKNLKELRNIYCNMPDVWSELRDYQSRTDKPYKGEGASVFDLEKRFALEREFEAAGKSTRSREFFAELKARIAE